LRQNYLGDHRTIARRLEELRAELIADLLASGFGDAQANRLIDNHMIGNVKPPRGQEAIAAGPDAVRIAETAGKLRRRTANGSGHQGGRTR
jgi:hypothetical protein